MANVHQFDVVVVGAGGAGLMAGLYASRTAKTAVISKLYPTRSLIRARHRAAFLRRWATTKKTNPNGTCTIPSKGLIISVIRTLLSS